MRRADRLGCGRDQESQSVVVAVAESAGFRLVFVIG
jgi:hypothetical protein